MNMEFVFRRKNCLVETLEMQRKWNEAKRVLGFHSTGVVRNRDRGWASLRCLGNCNVKTQQHLDNRWMLTPSNISELHLSMIWGWLINTDLNHRKRKAVRSY